MRSGKGQRTARAGWVLLRLRERLRIALGQPKARRWFQQDRERERREHRGACRRVQSGWRRRLSLNRASESAGPRAKQSSPRRCPVVRQLSREAGDEGGPRAVLPVAPPGWWSGGVELDGVRPSRTEELGAKPLVGRHRPIHYRGRIPVTRRSSLEGQHVATCEDPRRGNATKRLAKNARIAPYMGETQTRAQVKQQYCLAELRGGHSNVLSGG